MTDTVRLWDKNGIVCEVEPDEVDAFRELYAHRDFSREPRDIVLGCSKTQARDRFIANRVGAMGRRWKRKHAYALRDSIASGADEDTAKAAADERWGSEAPTFEAVTATLISEDMIPTTMQEEV